MTEVFLASVERQDNILDGVWWWYRRPVFRAAVGRPSRVSRRGTQRACWPLAVAQL